MKKKPLQERHLSLEKAIDIFPKSGETTAQQLKDLVAASDTSGEEPNILLRFVCSGKERKNLNAGIKLTQYLGIFPMTLENPFSRFD